MRSRVGKQLLTAGLATGALVCVAMAVAPSAQAAQPPVTGTVACVLTADSTFKPPLGDQAYPHDNPTRVSLKTNGKLLVTGSLTACSGSQGGGNPRNPGPIVRGELVARGTLVRHSCSSLSTNGVALRSLRIKWLNASGNRVGITKASGVATVTGLGIGWPYLDYAYDTVPDPGYVAPGIITFHGVGTTAANAAAFPNRPLTMTAVADRTVSTMGYPCSYLANPGPLGIDGFGFHAVNAPSTLSIG